MMEATFAFECKTPEIFDTLDEAHIAIDNNPLPFPDMKYTISYNIIFKGKRIERFVVNSMGADGKWFGFLNTKFKEV